MLCLQSKCCGVYGPEDWVKYDSSFRQQNSDAECPWPRLCCLQDAKGVISHVEGGKIGVKPFLYVQVVLIVLFVCVEMSR